MWPSILGGKNWEPMSFNPQTGIAYANTLAFGGKYKTEPAKYKPANGISAWTSAICGSGRTDRAAISRRSIR